MKVCVFGAGGIGGYFGGRLAASGIDTHFIARGAHLEAMRSRGLRIESIRGNEALQVSATDDPEAIGPCDVVLFCVKSTDTVTASKRLRPLLRENTAVVSLQNGVDNEDRIAEAVGVGHVVGGVAYILATISEPGTIDHQGELARIIFGEMDGKSTPRLGALLQACQTAGIDAQLTDRIRLQLWKKFAMICATAGMTAAVRLPLGNIRSSPAALGMYRNIVDEALNVARASSIPMPADTTDRIMETVSTLPGEWFSSLHYDLTHGKAMELDGLHGTLVRLAGEHGVPAPMSEAIYGVLEPWALRNSASK